jgi:hypothetical protein
LGWSMEACKLSQGKTGPLSAFQIAEPQLLQLGLPLPGSPTCGQRTNSPLGGRPLAASNPGGVTPATWQCCSGGPARGYTCEPCRLHAPPHGRPGSPTVGLPTAATRPRDRMTAPEMRPRGASKVGQAAAPGLTCARKRCEESWGQGSAEQKGNTVGRSGDPQYRDWTGRGTPTPQPGNPPPFQPLGRPSASPPLPSARGARCMGEEAGLVHQPSRFVQRCHPNPAAAPMPAPGAASPHLGAPARRRALPREPRTQDGRIRAASRSPRSAAAASAPITA